MSIGYHHADRGRLQLRISSDGARLPMTAPQPAPTSVQSFSGRVLILFVTSVLTTGIGIVIGFMLARVLGPSGKGDFYLLTLLPVTVMVLLQLGLPQAFGFFAARGQTLRINAMTLALTAVLVTPALIVMVLLLPWLQSTIFNFLTPFEILLGLSVLPFALNATFTTGILLGRRAVRWYAVQNVIVTIGSLLTYTFIVGVLGFGLVGALVAALLVTSVGSVAYFIGSVRASKAVPDRKRVSYGELFQYGLPLFPGTLTQFFSLRVDVYLLAWLLADPSAPLGYYSMAASMAQLVFFLPNAVSLVFFPHVAESTRVDSDRQVAMVSRVTLIVTAVVAVALIPVATVLINVILPAFEPALLAFYILLPGVVALSLTKVLSSYVTGLGMTGRTSIVNVGAMVVNIIVNFALIPTYGIYGAALASFASYSVSAVAFSILAARLAGAHLADFWIPRWTDVTFTVTTTIGLGRLVLRSIQGRL